MLRASSPLGRMLWFIILLVVMFAVLTFWIPMMQASMKTGEEAEGYADDSAFYQLSASAISLAPYLMVAPAKGNRLDPDSGDWFITAKGAFKGSVGENFVLNLIKSNYLERHAHECFKPDACISLSACVTQGKAIVCDDGQGKYILCEEDELSEDEIKEILGDIAEDCLNVAWYIIKRNQYMAEQAEDLSGSLSTSWTQSIP